MNTTQWLSRLISFNTISSTSNRLLIDDVAEWLKLQGIEAHIIPTSTSEKVNLWATIPAKNGQTQGGLILSGHTDVVPVAGQLWDTDPFVATLIDEKIYGRGACDMKGFIAVILAMVPEFKTLNLTKPLHLAFTCDEEIGCIGVDFLIEYLQKNGIKPKGCIVGEPSSMRPITGEKGRRVYHCQINGLAAHASLPNRGCNAIEYASKLICYINQLANNLKDNGPFDEDYDFPATTISTCIASGGVASNVIPDNCEFIFEIRYLPQFSHERFLNQVEDYINVELLPEMKKTCAHAAIFLDQTSDSPIFNASEEALISRVVRTVTGIGDSFKVSYSTEASAFQDANIPTIIWGPGSIEQAHRPNEYVSLEQLIICEDSLRNVVSLFCMDSVFTEE